MTKPRILAAIATWSVTDEVRLILDVRQVVSPPISQGRLCDEAANLNEYLATLGILNLSTPLKLADDDSRVDLNPVRELIDPSSGIERPNASDKGIDFLLWNEVIPGEAVGDLLDFGRFPERR